MNQSNGSPQTYVFGRSVGEAQAIQQLAQILASVTRQFLEQAGLCAGLKVLEVGGGAGDVAMLAAELVGPSGTVLGMENNPTIQEVARAQPPGSCRCPLWKAISPLWCSLTRSMPCVLPRE